MISELMFLIVIIITKAFGDISTKNEANFVNCIKAIIEKELPELHPLIISYSRENSLQKHQTRSQKLENGVSWKNFADSLTKSVHEINKWSLIKITSEEANTNLKTNNNLSYKSLMYLILIETDGINTVSLEQLHKHIQSLERYSFWNGRSKFVAVIIQDKLENDPEKLAKAILKYLFKYYIINVAVVIFQNSSKNINELQGLNENIFLVYSWFPYKNLKDCTSVQTAIIVNIWIPKDGGKFIHKETIFPNKIKNNLHGCTIRAVTMYPQPTVVNSVKTINSTNGTGTDKIIYSGGTGLILIETLAKALNFSIEFIVPPKIWGFQIPNSTKWIGVIGLITDKQADLAFGGSPILSEWTPLVDYTITVHIGGLVWWVPCAQSFPKWKSIIRIFIPTVWFVGFISIVAAGFIMRILSSTYGIGTLIEWKIYRDIGDCLMNSWAVLLGISVPDMPKINHLRMFFIAWVSYCFAFNTIFQTKLTSFLIDPGLDHQISTIEEMINSDLKLGVRNKLSKEYILKSYEKISSNKIIILEVEEALKNITFNRDISYLEGLDFIDALRSKYVKEDGSHMICTFDERLVSFFIANIIPKHSPLLDALNNVLRRLFEGNFISLWLRSMKGNEIMKSAFKRQLISDNKDYCPLGIVHLQSSFYLLLFGEGISIVVFIIEIIIRSIFSHFKIFQTIVSRRKTTFVIP
ncbi:hypothetical protein L9F63_026853 [Diploptera punctata]|uniref:Putative ionotropic receptor ligand binding domain-containing protein n=1 Tax=Diploptera punctata TaxID=6984 RepID=A0AAD8AFG8_DIPPU|nr:hypothetical protein L9F63_026853 [Diploptera punctata]